MDPIRNCLNHVTPEQHMKLMIYLAKALMVVATRNPNLSLECFLSITRAKWPSKVIAITTIPLYPINRIQDEGVLRTIFRELYNLYQSSQHSVQHQQEYVGKYILPFMPVIAKQIYALDERLAALNGYMSFPVIRAMRVIAEQASGAILREIIQVLFSLAFKSGSLNPNELPLLGQLRIECCGEIRVLCSNNGTAIFALLDEISKQLDWLMQTQPHTLNTITKMIDDMRLDKVILSDDVELEIILKYLKPSNQGNGRVAMIQIGKKLIERMSWRSQTQTIRFAFLEKLLALPNQTQEVSQWILNLVTNSKDILNRKL